MLVVGCVLTLAVAAWHDGPTTPSRAVALAEPRRVGTLRPDDAVLPWIAEIRSRIRAAPTPLPAEIPAAISPPPLTLASSAMPAEPEASASEDTTSDVPESTDEAPEPQKYFDAWDRAAAHSARSR